jgi:hypothetical protein
MSATEDESQDLDAGWDDDEPAADAIDQAWDSVSPPPTPAPAPGLNAAAPSTSAVTEEVDSGWDDVPVAERAQQPTGKRRPHRQRRAKANVVVASANPVLMPRPAEPSKKHQREHARKQRATEAQVKQQRKLERKAQRLTEAREEAAERLRRAEAQERARKLRREARERAESERPAPKAATTPQVVRKQPRTAPVTSKHNQHSKRALAPKRGLRPGVIAVLVVLALVALYLMLGK